MVLCVIWGICFSVWCFDCVFGALVLVGLLGDGSGGCLQGFAVGVGGLLSVVFCLGVPVGMLDVMIPFVNTLLSLRVGYCALLGFAVFIVYLS